MNLPWKKQDAELERELNHHLAELTDEFMRRGFSVDDARRMAKKEFGGPAQIGEQCRDESRWSWAHSIFQYLQFGWRMMWKSPAVTIAAVLSLALGIGANTAIVSLMHTVLWRQLPLPAAEQLTLVLWTAKERSREVMRSSSGSMYPGPGGTHIADMFSYTGYNAMRRAMAGKADLAAYQHSDDVSLVFGGRPTVGAERPVSGNFFRVMGVKPALGRLFNDEDDRPAAAPTVVLTHRFWKNFLHEDPNVIGKTLRVNHKAREITGVLESGFYGLLPADGTDIYVPTNHGAWLAEERRDQIFPLVNDLFWCTQLIARRAPGLALEELQPQFQAAFQNSWPARPKNMSNAPRIQLDDGSAGLGSLRRNYKDSLFVLAGLVLLVLCIACANIANLLLARANARRKEVALRISLGCARGRLLRQFLTESALLALLGGIASIVVAYLSSNLLATFMANRRSRVAFEIGVDGPMILAAIGFTLVTLLLFGLFPAWRSSRVDTSTALKEGSGSLGGSNRHWWSPGKILVVAQMAFSIVLVAAAVLFVRNLQSVESLDPGYDRRNLLMFGTRPGTSGYSAETLPGFYANLERSLGQSPGVEAVGFAMVPPMDGGGYWDDVRVAGGQKNFPVAVNRVTPGYVPVHTPRAFQGRNINVADIASQAKVAVISEDLARMMDAEGSMLGRKIHFSENAKEVLEVVGIAPAIAYNSLTQRPQVVWLPFDDKNQSAVVLLRTKGKPSSILPAIEETVRRVDANLPMVDVVTMDEQIGKGLQRERMFATLCGAFGVLALTLSAIGLYGVMSYNASRRRNEIGVRLALGALPRDVVRMVVREGLYLTIGGLLLGMPVIWYGAKYVEKEVAGGRPLNPLALGLAALILGAAAFVAAWLPARRASRLDPASALRQE